MQEQYFSQDKCQAVSGEAGGASESGADAEGCHGGSVGDEPWEYYVVTCRETIERLSESTPYTGCAKGAPLVFAACYRKECLRPMYAHIDMSASVENLLLEADELGLGAVWMGIAPLEDRMQTVKEIIGLPDGLEAFALIACGYPVKEQEQQDRYDEARVHYIK